MQGRTIINIINYILLAISIVLIALFYLGGVVPGTEGTSFEEPKITGLILNWSYVLMIASLVITLAATLVNILTHKGRLKSTLISLGIVSVVTIISYSLSSGEVLNIPGYTGTDNVPGTLKMLDAAIYAMYIALFSSFALIIYTSVAKYFK